MAEQTINADFNTLTGAAAANVAVRIRRLEIFGVSGEVVLGGTHTVTADGAGLATFMLEPGGYVIEYESNAGSLRAAFTVGEAGPYNLGALIDNQAIPVTPSVLLQAIAAKDAAEAAAATSVGLQAAIQIRNLSVNHTLALADAGYLLVFNAAATLTIPPQASVAWPAGTVVAAAQTASATLTVAGGAGVTIIADGSPSFWQGQAGTLIRTAENEWLLLGDLA